MNKSDLLASIEVSTRGIAKVEPVMVSPTEQEIVIMQNGKDVRKYSVNVAVNQGDTVTFQNIPIVVFNEGKPDEEALLSQGQEAPKAKDIETKASNYLNGLVNDGTFFGFKIIELNEVNKYAIANVIENINGTATRKSVLVYKPQGSPLTHMPFTE